MMESRRIVAAATGRGLTVRVLGSAAVCLQAPDGRPLLARTVRDIDLVTRREDRRAIGDLLKASGYLGDEMFNALHGARRLLFHDPVNQRRLDVFVGVFSMCHAIPIAERLDREALTVPLAELMLTKLQVVELTERDQRDIYNLCFHHDLGAATDGSATEMDVIAGLCAKDWGLWRTCRTTVERCLTNLAAYPLEPAQSALITDRIGALWRRIEEAPKTAGWRLRSRVGDRVRWYQEPETEPAQA
jgi:hypothetical protein